MLQHMCVARELFTNTPFSVNSKRVVEGGGWGFRRQVFFIRRFTTVLMLPLLTTAVVMLPALIAAVIDARLQPLQTCKAAHLATSYRRQAYQSAA